MFIFVVLQLWNFCVVYFDQAPTYNKYTLPGERGTTEQVKEILIRRHKSLQQSLSQSDSDQSQKEVYLMLFSFYSSSSVVINFYLEDFLSCTRIRITWTFLYFFNQLLSRQALPGEVESRIYTCHKLLLIQ